jgi:hypothetical protein
MASKPIPAAVQQNVVTILKTQADIGLEILQARNQARLDNDDARRAKDAKVAMVCVSPFTIVDDPAVPEGRTVQAGQEMLIPAGDVQAYTGRMRLKLPDVMGEPDRPRPTVVR